MIDELANEKKKQEITRIVQLLITKILCIN